MAWIAIVSVSNLVQAQVSDRFPDSVTTQINGERYEAFDLGGFTELLHIDADLAYYSRLANVLTTNVNELRAQNTSLQDQVDANTHLISVLRSERSRLHDLWVETNRKYREEQNKPNISSWLGWGVAGAFIVATLVLGIEVAVRH